MEDLVYFSFKATKEFKKRVTNIAYKRKLNEEPNATFKDVATELLEKALALPEYASEETNNSNAA